MDEWLDRYKAYVLAVLLVAIAAGSVLFWLRRPQPAPIVILTPVPVATPTAVPSSTPAPVRVYVTGAVREPDVYVLSPGSIVKDAVIAAGGVTGDADLERINLAVQVHDQQQVYVPRQGEGTPPVPPVGTALPAAGSRLDVVSVSIVNINSASAAELEALPGIGPAFAQRIVDYRTEHGPFVVVEDIMEVKGIGPTTFAKLEDLITVH